VAPEILARPTYLALVRLFDVFQPAESCSVESMEACGEYGSHELEAINAFLDQVTETSVMRRAFRHVSESLPLVLKRPWKEVLFRLWFQRRGQGPCVFEHVFLGNLSEDMSGQPIAGGFHNWLKFYLEEVRGTAHYLGYIYNCPADGLNNSRFVSGKFVWEFAGLRLVKSQGGFFVGTSPEWQLASGTVAYFETATPECAEKHGWVPWPGAYSNGYTKDVTHDRDRYRHVVCRGPHEASDTGEYFVADGDDLTSVYATFLGSAALDDDADTSELDRVCTSVELAARLPTWLVTDGIALREDSRLCEESVRFCVTRGCRSIREALKELRSIFDFSLEEAVAAAKADGYPAIRKLVTDTTKVAPLLVHAAAGGSLSQALPGLLKELKAQGRRGARIHQPVRLLLTGRADGARVVDIVQLLELAVLEGADGVGARLPDRITLVRELFVASVPIGVDELTFVS